MSTQVKRRTLATQESASTKSRNLRTFLLMQQFEAREIGARIAQARKERGMIQDDLVGLSPFSKRSLQDYEAGVTIPYRHLAFIARVLGRSVEWFLHGEEREATGPIQERLESIERHLALIEERLPANPESSETRPVHDPLAKPLADEPEDGRLAPKRVPAAREAEPIPDEQG